MGGDQEHRSRGAPEQGDHRATERNLSRGALGPERGHGQREREQEPARSRAQHRRHRQQQILYPQLEPGGDADNHDERHTEHRVPEAEAEVHPGEVHDHRLRQQQQPHDATVEDAAAQGVVLVADREQLHRQQDDELGPDRR